MSVTIDSLDIQIKSSATSATNEIQKIIAALEQLQNTGKFGRTTAALRGLGDQAKKTANRLSFSAGIHGLQTFASAAGKLASVIGKVTNEAMQWDGISFRFGRAFGEDAEEVYEWVLKLEDALHINAQQFMQYSSMFGSLLKGFGLDQDKVTTMSVGLTELSYDVWAAYNDRYQSLNDAYEAVRSAITGEIEPIRNAGIALTEASMQEYLDSVGLATVKVASLSEAQKSQVRYAVMASAAMDQGIIGTYAREVNTAEGAARALSQQVKGLAQAIGALLTPALTVVIKWVSAFVSILTSAVVAIGRLFGITKSIGPGASSGLEGITEGANDAEKALGGAGGAAKKLKDYMMGFDELNVINPDTGGGGGGGGAALDALELPDFRKMWDESTLKQALGDVDKLRQKILDFFDEWGWAIAAVGAGLTLLAAWAVFKGSPLDEFLVTITAGKGLGAALKKLIPDIDEKFKSLSRPLKNVLNLFKSIGTAVKTFVATASASTLGVIAGIIVAVASAAYFLYENWDAVTAKVKEFYELRIASHIESIKEHLAPLAPLFEKIVQRVQDLVAKFKALEWGNLPAAIEKLGGVIVTVVGTAIMTNLEALVVIFDLVLSAGAACVEGVKQKWEGLKSWWTSEVSPIFTVSFWENLFDTIRSAVDTKLDETKKTIAEKWQGIKSWWDSNVAPKFTKTYWLNKFDVFRSAVREKIEATKGAIQEKWDEIMSWFDSTVAPMLELSYWTDKLNTFLDMGRTIVENIKSGLAEKWEELTKWWKELILPEFKVKIPKFSLKGLFDAKAGTTPDVGVDWVLRAGGGFPSVGEMFIAREAGPELVGNINGRTAVANNDQIVTAVSQGVYEAVRSAMSGMNDSENAFNVNVFLDSKQITAAVEKRQRERGVAMMTGGVAFA